MAQLEPGGLRLKPEQACLPSAKTWKEATMCGFAGFLDPLLETSEQDLKTTALTMAASLSHRGPDSCGSWADPASGLALGHQRLAIIDLSPAGHQPMISPCGRYVVAYNGEIYNFPELRGELEAKGHAFRGHSDTEVMLAAIVEWGLSAAVRRFIGMFAFVLWDRQSMRLQLVRDRLGIKPVYYGWNQNQFLFGSELTSFAGHPAFAPKIDRDVLALYLARGHVPCPFSIYQGIFKLEPGSILSLAPGKTREPTVETFWSLHDVAEAGAEHPFEGSEEEATIELERILGDAVEQRMIADVPLGVLLSGGIDSTAVAALMQARCSSPIKSFTIGFEDDGYNEAGYAEAIAKRLGTDHTTLRVTPDQAMAIIPRLGAMYDEPFADASQVPTYVVSKLARESVKVVLTGDGGDEGFGGYERHLWCDRIMRTNASFPGWSRRAASYALTRFSPEHWNRILRFVPGSSKLIRPGQRIHRLAQLLDTRDAGEIYRRLMTQWSDASAVALDSNPPETLLARREDWPTLRDPTSLFMYLDAMTYLPDQCLTKVDRASMAVGLEARIPMLDHRVAGFAWSLPMVRKISRGQGKQVLRRMIDRYLPRSLVDRPKMGFGVPIRHWLRGPLRTWAEELLSERRLSEQGFLNPTAVRRRWREHQAGSHNWHNQIWIVLMFQLWLEEQRL